MLLTSPQSDRSLQLGLRPCDPYALSQLIEAMQHQQSHLCIANTARGAVKAQAVSPGMSDVLPALPAACLLCYA